jgi:hypothetical protein
VFQNRLLRKIFGPQREKPNIVIERLTILLHNLKVPGSNLGPGTGYTDMFFSWLSSVPPGVCRDSALKLGHDRFLSNSSFIYHPFIRRYIVSVTERAS